MYKVLLMDEYTLLHPVQMFYLLCLSFNYNVKLILAGDTSQIAYKPFSVRGIYDVQYSFAKLPTPTGFDPQRTYRFGPQICDILNLLGYNVKSNKTSEDSNLTVN
jgi:hypothetical protein